MESTTRRDDELAQQAPLVPDIGRADGTRADGGRATAGKTRTMAIQRTYDDELRQEAPLVPDVGRPDSRRPADPTEPPR